VKRAALYVRVSTDHQTLENQTRELRQIAERRGWEVVEIYLEAIAFIDPDFFPEGHPRYMHRVGSAWSRHATVSLSTGQMAKIIVATGLPLIFFEDHKKLYQYRELKILLSKAWSLEENEHGLLVIDEEDYGILNIVDELHTLLRRFGGLRASLTGFANENVRSSLKKGAMQLRASALRLRSHEFEIAFSEPETKKEILAKAACCEVLADYCQRLAAVAGRKTKQHRALIRLMKPLTECYQALFGKEPRGGWRYERPKAGDEVDGPLNRADSPFIRFATSFCDAVGYQVKALTLQTALYEFCGMQKEK
jgi:Resolvase, N terminal domain